MKCKECNCKSDIQIFMLGYEISKLKSTINKLVELHELMKSDFDHEVVCQFAEIIDYLIELQKKLRDRLQERIYNASIEF